MAFIDYVLEAPSYGFVKDGALVVPTQKQILREFMCRLNCFSNKKNWIVTFIWVTNFSFIVPLYLFLTQYFSWPLAVVVFLYSMVILGTFGTVWYHRYATHRAFKFSHPFWCFVVRNFGIKMIPDELYVVSHHVHHSLSEKPGDPYNSHAGWLYCFLADANHQRINQNLSAGDYNRVCAMLSHTGIRMNTYEQYKTWGSVCHPLTTFIHFALNWAFWFGVFYLLGGPAWVCAIFGACFIWGIGIRTFNYGGHGSGKDKRQEGTDFFTEDQSINQLWPGYVAGEWHNNHHLYPKGSRAGFLPYQIDGAWYAIKFLSLIGGVSSYRDFTADFFRDHYQPYLDKKKHLEKLVCSTDL